MIDLDGVGGGMANFDMVPGEEQILFSEIDFSGDLMADLDSIGVLLSFRPLMTFFVAGDPGQDATMERFRDRIGEAWMDLVGENGCSSLAAESMMGFIELVDFDGDMESIFIAIGWFESNPG